MIAVTIGGILYQPIQDFVTNKLSPIMHKSAEMFAALIYLLAAAATAVPVLCLGSEGKPSTLASSYPIMCLNVIMASFLVFELCVGMFMPVAGTLRSKYVPDALQGGILNIFRLPLNAIVVSGTYATDYLEAALVYKLISVCLLLSALLQATMMLPTRTDGKESSAKKKSQ